MSSLLKLSAVSTILAVFSFGLFAQIPTDSLVSFWTFNEGSGTIAHDSSGHNRTAALHGASWASGISGNALSLTDSSQYAQADSTSAYSSFQSAITISLWVNPSVKPAFKQRTIVNKFTQGVEDKFVLLDTNMTVEFFLYGVMATSSYPFRSKSRIAVNQWTNITATYNGSVAILYINGVLDSSHSYSGSISNGTGILYVGNQPNRPSDWGSNNGLIGTVDNLLIYKRAISAAEISAIYSSTAIQIPPVPILSSPSNGTMGVTVNPTLSWNGSSGATSYRVQISNTTSFALVSDTAVSGIYRITSSLTANSPYYWRVYASNSAGNSVWSSIWSFTTVGIPSVPTLSSPVNGSINVPFAATISWNSVSTAISYRVQFSNSSSFSLVNDTILSGTSRTTSSLASNTAYYWRVYASNSAGNSAWSGIWSFSTAAPPVGDTSLISYWTFNEGSGTIVHDSSGHNRTAVIHGNNYSYTTGITGTALLFSDTSNYILADSTAAYSNFTNALTFSLWVKPTVYKACRLIEKWSSGRESKSLYLSDSLSGPVLGTNIPGKVAMKIYPMLPPGYSSNTSLEGDDFISKSSLKLNQWSNVTISYDGSRFCIYINGLLDTSATVSGAIGNSTGQLWVGRNMTGGTDASTDGYADLSGCFLGAMDNIRIYKRALSASEVATIYAEYVSTTPSAPALSSPANNALNVPISTTLAWNPSSGATSYRVQLSNSTSFSLVSDTTLSATSRAVVSLTKNAVYYWRVSAINSVGTSAWSNIWSFTTNSTGVLPNAHAYCSRMVSFSNSGISYDLPTASSVSIVLYDMQGRQIRQLLNAMQIAGSYRINFNHAKITAGYYIVKFKAGTFEVQKKLALIN